jgi:hypothetical protein
MDQEVQFKVTDAMLAQLREKVKSARHRRYGDEAFMAAAPAKEIATPEVLKEWKAAGEPLEWRYAQGHENNGHTLDVLFDQSRGAVAVFVDGELGSVNSGREPVFVTSPPFQNTMVLPVEEGIIWVAKPLPWAQG